MDHPLYLAQIPTCYCCNNQQMYPDCDLSVPIGPQTDTSQSCYCPPSGDWVVSSSAREAQSIHPCDIPIPWDTLLLGWEQSIPGRLLPESMLDFIFPPPSITIPVASAPEHPFLTQWPNQNAPFDHHSWVVAPAIEQENWGETIPTATPLSPHPSSESADRVHLDKPLPTTSESNNTHSKCSMDVYADSTLPSRGNSKRRSSRQRHPDCPPYSQLIYRALRATDGHRLKLQEIYTWFEQNTDKADGSQHGWQNSIRHNLSMNKVRITPL